MADTLPSGNKAMAGCVSRLREALNLLPRTDSQSLGETIAATLSAGRSVLQKQSPSVQSARNGEQPDLRQQQVGILLYWYHSRNLTSLSCSSSGRMPTVGLSSAIQQVRVLLAPTIQGADARYGQIKCVLGLQLARYRTVSGGSTSGVVFKALRRRPSHGPYTRMGIMRKNSILNYVRFVISQVRRCMGESFGLLRKGEVEHAFRRAFGVVPHARWQALLGRTDIYVRDAGAGFSRLDNSGTFRSSVRLSQFREDGVCMSEEWRKRTRSYRIRRRGASAIELTRAERAATVGQVATVVPTGVGLDVGGFSPTSSWQRGGGALSALAVSLAEISDCGDGPGAEDVTPPPPENTLDETGEVLSFFLEVGITGSLDVEHTVISSALPTAGQARKSLRQVVGETYQLFPCQPLSELSCGSLEAALLPSETPPVLGAKRAASCLDAPDLEGANGLGRGIQGVVNHEGFCSTTLDAMAAVETAQAQLHTAVQMYHRLVPFARLQHGLLRVGSGLSLDFRQLTHFSGATQQVPHCAVFLAGEHGWSSPEVAATSARVTFFAGHTQADTWEWDVALGPTSSLMDYVGAGAAKGEGPETSATREVVYQQLPLVRHFEITGLHGEGDESGTTARGKHVKFRFPRAFSVHAMCRSFALAGEGLAAMHTLAAQASKLRHAKCESAGYRVVTCSPVHVAMRESGLDHVVVLTHSAFSARHISSAERPGLVLISWPHVPTCPAAMRELEASVRKHRDLNALLHGLSRTVAVLAVVSSVVPDVGVAGGVHGDRSPAGGGTVLTAVSPARFVLSATSVQNRQGEPSQPKPVLTLAIEAGGQVRVSRVGEKDVTADTDALRDLLLEWIASSP